MPVAARPGWFGKAEIGQDLAEFYRENGFAVVSGALSDREVDDLNEEAVAICRGQRGEICRFEAPPAELTDNEVLKRILCIHHPHKVSERMLRALAHPAIVKTLTTVIGPNVKCMQSMLFIKAAGKPGQAWHQDEDYIPTRDRSMCGAWIAMDDATVENGCLWIIPGSQKPGVLWPQYPHDDSRFDCNVESFDFPYTDDDAIPVEVSRGSVVFFHGYTLHRSLPNRAREGFRRALVNHYMSAESLLPWIHEQGVGMAKQDYRDIVMVAGRDPYHWKEGKEGPEIFAQAHIRRDGEGGCGDGRVTLEEYKVRIDKGLVKPR